jgi:hypothetical protein
MSSFLLDPKMLVRRAERSLSEEKFLEMVESISPNHHSLVFDVDVATKGRHRTRLLLIYKIIESFL